MWRKNVENTRGFNRGSVFAEAPARQVTRMPLIQDGKEKNPRHQSILVAFPGFSIRFIRVIGG
jgi:hypothetical protein